MLPWIQMHGFGQGCVMQIHGRPTKAEIDYFIDTLKIAKRSAKLNPTFNTVREMEEYERTVLLKNERPDRVLTPDRASS